MTIGDVNEWGFHFQLVVLMDREYPLKWCQWKGQLLSIDDVNE